MNLAGKESMRTIFLLRHAEAASPSGVSDRDRPLTDKGRVDAKCLGEVMRTREFTPDVILCSPARRTRETLEGLAFENVPTNFLEALYNAPPENLLNALCQVNDACESVLLIAHNPSIPTLAAALAGSGDPASLMKLNSGYAPATLSILTCRVDDWGFVDEQSCRLIDVVTV
jgi:phosphohistidine phosphatase